ncbi:hypothetical protein SCACP_17450 [Sporomusa carbonis]|uniref:spore coat protein n=1 Tax=Sporomusa carbonis TaxID=3076075 RepID=UPI003A79DCAC
MAHVKRYTNNAITNNSSRNRLSDRDMIVDLINTEKHLSHLYEHAIMESSNVTVHNTMEEFQHDEHENAFTLFNAMQQRGWYNLASGDQEQKQRLNSRKIFNVRSNRRNARNNFGDYRGRSNSQYQYT